MAIQFEIFCLIQSQNSKMLEPFLFGMITVWVFTSDFEFWIGVDEY